MHETSGLVVISKLLPGNGWFSCLLNKTYSNSVNFGSFSIVQILGMGLFLHNDGPVLSVDGSIFQKYGWTCNRKLK